MGGGLPPFFCKASRPPQYALFAWERELFEPSWVELRWVQLRVEVNAEWQVQCQVHWHWHTNEAAPWPPRSTPFSPMVNPLSSDCQCNFVANLEDVALPSAERLLFRSQGCKGRPCRGGPGSISLFPNELGRGLISPSHWVPLVLRGILVSIRYEAVHLYLWYREICRVKDYFSFTSL